MAKDIFYFSHDSNARNDDKLIEVRMKYDWYGYGVYFAIIEILREQENYTYPSNAKAKLAYSLNIPLDKFEPIYDMFFDVKLFIEKDGVFYSESLMKRMEKIDKQRAKRVAAGRKGGIAKAKLKQSSSKKVPKKGKKREVKESKVNKTKENINVSFDEFWDLYDKKVGDKKKLIKKWESLKDSDRELIIDYIPKYIKSQPEKGFRKNPETFLNNRSWKDEIILNNSHVRLNINKSNYGYQNLQPQDFKKQWEMDLDG